MFMIGYEYWIYDFWTPKIGVLDSGMCVVPASMLCFVLFQSFLLITYEDVRIREVRLYDEELCLVVTPF